MALPLPPIVLTPIAPGVPGPTFIKGDVTGTLSASTVAKIEGNPIQPVIYGPAQDGYALTWNNADGLIEPKPILTSLAGSMLGDVIGSTHASIVSKMQGNPIKAVTYGSAQDGYVLSWVNADGYIEAIPPPVKFTAGGDLSGNYLSQNVIKLQGNPIQPATYGSVQDGYFLSWSNIDQFLEMRPGPSGSFSPGGDLTGNSSNQTVRSIQGNPVQSTVLGSAQDGYVLTWINADGLLEAKPTLQLSDPVIFNGTLDGASSAITGSGYAIQTTASNTVKLATSLISARFTGVALSQASPGGPVNFQTTGPISPSTFNLGAGLATAVGTNSSAGLVRVTDPTCISAPNYIGYCDTNGTVTISPRLDREFNILDFGAVNDGITDATASIVAALSAAAAKTLTLSGKFTHTGGVDIFIPQGQFLITQTLIIPPYVNIVGTGSSTSVILANIPASPQARPWGSSILLDYGVPSNSTTSQSFKRFSICNIVTGTAAQRAANGGSGIEVVGVSQVYFEDIALYGHKRGVTVDGSDNTTFDGVQFFAASLGNIGYPDHTYGYNDSVGLWLAFTGSPAIVTSVATAPNTLTNGDDITLAFDFGTNNTVTFSGSQTVDQVVTDINTACGGTFASNVGGQLVLTSALMGMDRGLVNIVSGLAVSKLGLTVGKTYGQGNGHGMEAAYPFGQAFTNVVRVIDCKFFGVTNIWEQDGVSHTFRNCTFEGPGTLALIGGGGSVENSSWEGMAQEGNTLSSGLFKIRGRMINLSIRDSEFAGSAGVIGTSLIEIADINSIDGTSTIQNLVIRNVVYSSTHDGRAIVNLFNGSSLTGGCDLSVTSEDASPTLPVGTDGLDLYRQNACVYCQTTAGSIAQMHGFNTGNPEAMIDVDLTATYPPFLFRFREGYKRRFSALPDGSIYERGMGTVGFESDAFHRQQGIREFFNKGTWDSAVGGKAATVVIDFDQWGAGDIEVNVLMLDGAGNSGKSWILRRFTLCASNVVSIDSETSKDDVRSIGVLPSSGYWIDPTLDLATNKITVNIQPATTSFGDYLVYAKIIHRSHF